MANRFWSGFAVGLGAAAGVAVIRARGRRRPVRSTMMPTWRGDVPGQAATPEASSPTGATGPVGNPGEPSAAGLVTWTSPPDARR